MTAVGTFRNVPHPPPLPHGAAQQVPCTFPDNRRGAASLTDIATAIATWLGALSRSHGIRAHHKGGEGGGEWW